MRAPALIVDNGLLVSREGEDLAASGDWAERDAGLFFDHRALVGACLPIRVKLNKPIVR